VTSTVPNSTQQLNGGVNGEVSDPAEPAPPAVTPLLEPVEGVPPVVTDVEALADVARRLADGEGPVAFDAERASGYRYSQRAYLVQIRRRGAGTALIDPICLPDLAAIQDAVGSAEWVLHAASQDLPCLAELGLRPTTLFDT
jgi:ribonuclease D